MKQTISALFIIITLNSLAQHPGCDGNRYKNYVFATYDSTINVQYGQNYTMNNVLQNLIMDVYEPHADTLQKRPVIVMIHGGSFTGHTRQDEKKRCIYFAKKGFVAATIEYRLIDVPWVDSTTIVETCTKAASDMKAAIRYFVEDEATSNTYKIDSNYIFIEGGSAGGMAASQAAYLDSTDNIPAYIATIIAANGGFQGNSSTNNIHTTPIRGVINYSGALWRKDWISHGEPPLYSAHGLVDTIVSCGHGLCDAWPFPVIMDGSCAMQQEANSKGVYNQLYLDYGTGHCDFYNEPALDTVLQQTADFLYNLICTNVSVNEQANADNQFKLYPNPANETINITLPINKNEKEEIQLFNSIGMLLKETEASQSTQLNIGDLPSGLYFIHLKNHPQTNGKFIKE